MRLISRIPLLLIILAIFNTVIIRDPNALKPEAVQIFSWSMPSGGIWHATKGDFVVIAGIFLLFLEILKSTKVNTMGTILEHILSLFVFVAFLVEFIVWPAACNSTCVVLMLICLLDVLGGFAISFSSARRDLNLGGLH